MYVLGADHYYHEATPEERDAHARMLRKIGKRSRGDSSDEQWKWTRHQRKIIFRTTRFLVFASDALLTGRWTIGEAYALFGPEVARHYQTILWMADRLESSEILFASPGGGKDWQQSIDQLRKSNFHDSQDALVVLAFILRAEQCRRGDTHPWFVSSLVEDLRGRWDQPTRRALLRASRARKRLFPRVSLVTCLHRARYPFKRSGYEFEKQAQSISELQPEHFRRPYESAKGNAARISRIAREAEF